MKKLMLNWFEIHVTKAARQVLIHHYSNNEVQEILLAHWQKYLQLKKDVPAMPTMGGSIMVHLAAMSTAFYQELIARSKSKAEATQVFYDIAWKVYIKMGKFSWRLAGIGKKNNYLRLLKPMAEKQKLLDQQIVLCKTVCNDRLVLKSIGIPETRIPDIILEAKNLCEEI